MVQFDLFAQGPAKVPRQMAVAPGGGFFAPGRGIAWISSRTTSLLISVGIWASLLARLRPSRESAEYPVSDRYRAHPDESRKNPPIGSRNDAVANQVPGSRCRRCVWRQDLLKVRRCSFPETPCSHQCRIGALLIGCTLIRSAIIRSGFRRNRSLPVSCRPADFCDCASGWARIFLLSVCWPRSSRICVGVGSFQLQAFLVLLGIASWRCCYSQTAFRQNITAVLVSRHFKRPQHDFRQIWTRFGRTHVRGTGSVSLCVPQLAKLISETFNVFSVTTG